MVLTALYETWSADTNKDPSRELLTEHLSSHSARSGGAQDAQEHKDIQIQWVILRGKKFTMSKIEMHSILLNSHL